MLRAPSGAPNVPPAPTSKAESTAGGVGTPEPEIETALLVEKERSRSLAPDEQPSLGVAGGADFAELFALLGCGPEPGAPSPTGPAKAEASSAGVSELTSLVERWVKRVALGGDPRRGVAKLDIGAGRFAGSELLVVAEAGRVSVELSLPRAVEPGLAQRIRARLEQRGYAADVQVR